MSDEGNASRKVFESLSDMTSTLFNRENARKIAKLWIENSERAADEILKFQAKATEWSKAYNVRADLRDTELCRAQLR